MITHFTSDTHVDHNNILSFESCDKYRHDLYGPKTDPESVVRMREGIIKVWNDHVAPEDTVYHLGDVSLAYGNKKMRESLDRFLSRINGKIVLVKGNHDTYTTQEVFENYGHRVVDYWEINGLELKICLSHYAFCNWNKKHHGSIMLHGHEHGNLRHTEQSRGKTLDVGWDCWGRPLTLDEILEIMKGRSIVGEGHHKPKEDKNG